MVVARSGSALLLCLALAAFAVMVGYAFLRSAARKQMTGRSEQFNTLAYVAAQSALAHATEQILKDYNATDLDIASRGALVSVPRAPQHLDGPYRAPFVGSRRQNRLSYADSSNALEGVEVSEYNHLAFTLQTIDSQYRYAWWYDFHNSYDGLYSRASGSQVYDSRGHLYEPNYHNVTRPSPAIANPTPVVHTVFIDAAAPTPERNEGLFLDENLRRISGGTPDDRRRKARYRLRYAVGVEDLSGHFQTNPRAAMNLDWSDPDNDYRKVPAWVEHKGYVLQNHVSRWDSDIRDLPGRLRASHVFLGRGSASNADRAWASGSRNGLPATFPMMFRSVQNPTGSPAEKFPWYGNFSHWQGSTTDMQGGRIYGFSNSVDAAYESIAANPNGGEILTPVGQPPSCPYVHAQLGPQHSWWNFLYATNGYAMPDNWPSAFGNRGWFKDGQKSSPDFATDWARWNTSLTPFGRRIVAVQPWRSGHYYRLDDWVEVGGRRFVCVSPGVSSLSPTSGDLVDNKLAWRDEGTERRWYHGKLDNPWEINLLTAPALTISSMITSYLPPYVKSYRDAGGNPVMSRAHDILNAQLNSGLSEFSAPLDGGIVNYYHNYKLDPRTPEQRYPGPLCRSDVVAGDNLGMVDNLGKDIDVDRAAGTRELHQRIRNIAWCTHSYNPLLNYLHSNSRYVIQPMVYTDSYFFDLAHALSTAISYVRATWVQYPNLVFDPRTGFSPLGLRDPMAYDTIEEVDALFLRQLGEDWSNPGYRNGANPINSTATPKYIYSVDQNPVKNTIRSLVDDPSNPLAITISLKGVSRTINTRDRARVMERMLNDWRMSFLGASSGYVDFRPMDFDRNNKVDASCYDINPAATTDEMEYCIARWKPVEATGRGPAPTPFTNFDPAIGSNPWFSATGTFFIGKSHYFRVFTRGEVYDNLLQKPVAQQDMEAVLVVDPECPAIPATNHISTEHHFLFKQWRHNPNSSVDLPMQMR